MDQIAIDLGIVTITWYALCIVTGIIIAMIIANFELKNHDINKDKFFDAIFYMIIFGFIGARTWYVVFEFENYKSDLLSMFYIWEGGLAIHGGILAGSITLIHYCKKHSLNKYQILDIIAPGLLIAQSFGRWGNFFNSEAHGGETTREFLENTLKLPEFIVNGMQINGVYYQPTFLYESIWNFIGFLIIIFIIRKKYRYDFGYITSFYLIWYGSFRFFLEKMRTDALTFYNIEVAQVASVIMVLFGIYILYIKKGKNENRN